MKGGFCNYPNGKPQWNKGERCHVIIAASSSSCSPNRKVQCSFEEEGERKGDAEEFIFYSLIPSSFLSIAHVDRRTLLQFALLIGMLPQFPDCNMPAHFASLHSFQLKNGAGAWALPFAK
ncbi:hypothetical protein ACLOJK_026021 [Asimina triloba]